MRTLILNAGYEPMQLVSWERALCLVLSEKAEIVAEYGAVVRSVTSTFARPSVVRLKRYVRIVRHMGFVRCTRKNILLRDRYQCQYCGVRCKPTAITIDHVVPRARGGTTHWENVVAACHPCNRKKGSRALNQSGLSLIRHPRRPLWRELIDDMHRDAVSDWMPYLGHAS